MAFFNSNNFFSGGWFRDGEWAQIDSNIFIGSAKALADHKFLVDNKISLIVNASNREYNVTKLDIPTLLVLNIEDVLPHPNKLDETKAILRAKADSVIEVVDTFASKDKNVLIHCQAGVNRSSFLICWYLIKKRGYDPQTVIDMIKKINKDKRRTPALTNPMFEQMLLELS